VPDRQTVVSLSEAHRAFYLNEPGVRASQRIVQPCNRGTAPPIVHSLLSIERADPDATVAVMPCDHHYTNEDAFSSALESVFEAARQRRDSILLMGAQPDYPETEYGWIEPGAGAPEAPEDVFEVRAFQEKPSAEAAERLLRLGCLWNTFIMVGHVRAFLGAVSETLPGLVERLSMSALWDGRETHIRSNVYEDIPELGFSSSVLATAVSRLLVMRLENAGWTDLGNPVRAERAAARHAGDNLLGWLREWQPTQHAAQATAT
jgi:mannose-1-phosphate guanylyltransferase